MIGDYLQYCLLGTNPPARGVWMMADAASPIADSSGNGRTAVAAGTPDFLQVGPVVNGEQLAAVNLVDTSSEYLRIAATIDDGVSQFTAMAWFKTTFANGAGLLSQVYSGADNLASWQMWYQGGGTLGLFTYQTGGASFHGQTTLVGGGALDDNRWHCAIVWRDASGFSNVDIDGGLYTTQLTSFTGTWFGPTTADLLIGARTTVGDYFTGLVGPAAYWPAELTAAERLMLYTGIPLIPPGRVIDYSAFPKSSMAA